MRLFICNKCLENGKLEISQYGKKEDQNMQSRYSFLSKKKKQKKWPYIVSGSFAVLLIAGIVVWVGMNDWDIDKSIDELREL